MFERFKKIQSELIAQRYAWIREGVTAAQNFLNKGVTPEFKKHQEHANCTCMKDSEYWTVNAYDTYIDRHRKN